MITPFYHMFDLAGKLFEIYFKSYFITQRKSETVCTKGHLKSVKCKERYEMMCTNNYKKVKIRRFYFFSINTQISLPF